MRGWGVIAAAAGALVGGCASSPASHRWPEIVAQTATVSPDALTVIEVSREDLPLGPAQLVRRRGRLRDGA